MANKKYVYKFAEGNANMRELLGGKGANLSEMRSLNLPVPDSQSQLSLVSSTTQMGKQFLVTYRNRLMNTLNGYRKKQTRSLVIMKIHYSFL